MAFSVGSTILRISADYQSLNALILPSGLTINSIDESFQYGIANNALYRGIDYTANKVTTLTFTDPAGYLAIVVGSNSQFDFSDYFLAIRNSSVCAELRIRGGSDLSVCWQLNYRHKNENTEHHQRDKPVLKNIR
ncbi:unnamed protein product [Sphagnum balticum]